MSKEQIEEQRIRGSMKIFVLMFVEHSWGDFVGLVIVAPSVEEAIVVAKTKDIDDEQWTKGFSIKQVDPAMYTKPEIILDSFIDG